MNFNEACRAIISNRNEKALNYCVGYAQAGLGMDGHEAKVQALYILNNMSRWRGEEAKAVRTFLKEFSK